MKKIIIVAAALFAFAAFAAEGTAPTTGTTDAGKMDSAASAPAGKMDAAAPTAKKSKKKAGKTKAAPKADTTAPTKAE